MPDGFRPFRWSGDEQIKALLRAAYDGARRVREELERIGAAVPPSQLGQPSPTDDPEGYGRWDAERIERTLAADHAKAPEILRVLREAAEPLLDTTDEGDSAGSVVLAALTTLARIRVIVVRELGPSWARQVRPFRSLGHIRGADVGAAWVGESSARGEPVTLADAVEFLAADRVQWRREAEESRTRAAESVAAARAARRAANDALRQVEEAREYLDETLRPNARAHLWCEDCDAAESGRCGDHRPESDEPELPERLVDAVRTLVARWSDAEGRARSAARDRVSVYVGDLLVHGPDVAAPNPAPPHREAPEARWPESAMAREGVHRRPDQGSPDVADVTLCGLLVEDYRCTWADTDVTCPRCQQVIEEQTRAVGIGGRIVSAHPPCWPRSRGAITQ